MLRWPVYGVGLVQQTLVEYIIVPEEWMVSLARLRDWTSAFPLTGAIAGHVQGTGPTRELKEGAAFALTLAPRLPYAPFARIGRAILELAVGSGRIGRT